MSASIFDVGAPIATIVSTLLKNSDSVIGGVCSLAWTQIFPWIAALVLGFSIMGAIFSDDLVEGVRSFFGALIPLLIVAWFIEGGSTCRVAQLKRDIMTFQTDVTKTVGGEAFGGDASKTITNVFDQMRVIMQPLTDAVSAALEVANTPTSQTTNLVNGSNSPLASQNTSNAAGSDPNLNTGMPSSTPTNSSQYLGAAN